MEELRICIAGSRDFFPKNKDRVTAFAIIDKFVNELRNGKEVKVIIVCGECKGADLFGKAYARVRQYAVKSFPANWNDLKEGEPIKYNKAGKAYNPLAGNARNQVMADYSHAFILFHDGVSPGTKDMIKRVKNAKEKVVRVIKYARK